MNQLNRNNAWAFWNYKIWQGKQYSLSIDLYENYKIISHIYYAVL